ncbi:ankyrin repeat-containing domain protein, partial [Leptodontidium sp. MPI-SDFR-AT-0119]
PNTALEIAIIQNDIESVRLLLDYGADPELWLPWSEQNVRNNATSVCEAAALGHLDILRLLIEKGGLVTSIYENGETPLFQAVLADDIYFVERLLEKGASVTHIDKSGNTPLHASTSNHTSACSVIMQLLLHHGLSTCAINSNGRTALHKASSQGNVEALKLLLALNHDLIACKTPEGWTALHSAIDPFLHWKVDIAAILLANGADINAITKDGRTVLQLAIHISSGSMSTLRLLLDRGIDLESRDIQGRTPVLRAADYGRESRYQYVIELINRGAD